jgi:hypothetical protein
MESLIFVVLVVNLIFFIWFVATLSGIKKASDRTADYLWHIARAHGAPIPCVHGVIGQCAACNYRPTVNA